MIDKYEQFKKKSGATKARLFDRRVKCAPGVAFTDTTAQNMARLAIQGSRDPCVRFWAENLTRNIDGRDHIQIGKTIFSWMQDKGGKTEGNGVKFINDSFQTEQLRAAWITLFVADGADCDDHSIVNASLLMSLGVPCFIRCVKLDKNNPEIFTHVYTVGIFKRPSIKPFMAAMDTSVPFSTFGSEPSKILGKKDYQIVPGYSVESDWSWW